MEDKKPRLLDILRLIVASLILIGSIIIILSMWYVLDSLFNDDEGFSGLIFIFIIPIVLGAFVYLFISIKWIKKYNKIQHIPLIERSVTIGEPIAKSIIAIIFLSYASIPLIVYWTLDLIEAIMRKNLAEKLRGVKPEPEFKTNETNPISDKHYCKHCGKEVDYRYARFCEYCGKEIEYRK